MLLCILSVSAFCSLAVCSSLKFILICSVVCVFIFNFKVAIRGRIVAGIRVNAPAKVSKIFPHNYSYCSISKYFQTKTPSLWLCYLKTHWKMFAFGGLLKLLGDVVALIGPLSITLIVEYIELNARSREGRVTNDTKNWQTTTAAPSAPLSLPSFMNAGFGVYPNGSINLNMQYSMNEMKHHQQQQQQREPLPTTSSSLLLPLYYPSWSDFIANGWIIAVLVLFASFAQGSLSQMSTHIVNTVGTHIRTSLQCLVYRKTLLISSNCFYTAMTMPPSPSKTATTSAPTITMNKNNTIVRTDEASDAKMASITTITMPASMSTDNVDSLPQQPSSTAEANATNTESTSEQRLPYNTYSRQSEKQFIDAGTITNLMSNDALNVMSFLWIAHYVWAIPLKVCRM